MEESEMEGTKAPHLPTVIVVIGMAGSGKTTMVKALHSHLSKPNVNVNWSPSRDATSNSRDTSANEVPPEKDASPAPQYMEDIIHAEGQPSNENVVSVETLGAENPMHRPAQRLYSINLDPAVLSTLYPVNIDIRETVKYKKVMKNYKLGPNGAILTSLNLFATKFDQVLQILEKRAKDLDYVIIDTPGQIEAFNWSASGSIILDSLAVTFPTLVLYVVDTVRCRSPVSFMSNMIYACSVLYKTKLPFVLAFNKIDVCSSEKCKQWMHDYGAFADDTSHEDAYMASLSRSCALTMSEFYEGIRTTSVSAGKQLGLVSLEAHFIDARKEYFDQYLPWLEEQKVAVKKRRQELAKKAAERFRKDQENAEDLEEDEEERRLLQELREKMKVNE